MKSNCLFTEKMTQYNPRRAIIGSVAVIAVALLAAAAIVRHYRKTAASSLLDREYFMVPEFLIPARRASQLFSFPGGMPGNGYSGRATNEEDVSDPYGGGDQPGPYGRVNDPYDGDWALNPLGGKQIKMQSLPMVQPAVAEDNIWNEGDMGTNSIFMHKMSSKDANAHIQAQQAKLAPSAPIGPGGPGADSSWVGTNEVFFGSNGGGYGWARREGPQASKRQALRGVNTGSRRSDGRGDNKIQSVPVLGGTNIAFNGADGYHYGWARKPAAATTGKQAVPRSQKSLLQSLFRSGDAHEAEYGREGDNQLDDDVLPSAVGSGGPVIGVDGKPSNLDHTWAPHPEEFSFKCSDDIYGCAGGLTVDPEYAAD